MHAGPTPVATATKKNGEGLAPFPMVAFIPLWMLAALWAFAFRTGLRAWLWLGATAASGFGLLWLLRHFDWVQ